MARLRSFVWRTKSGGFEVESYRDELQAMRVKVIIVYGDVIAWLKVSYLSGKTALRCLGDKNWGFEMAK